VNETSRVDINALFEEGTPIDKAMNAAAQEAVRLHKEKGLPMAVWRNGKVEWVPADESDAGPPRDAG
jgi:hypothetical protein